MLQWLSKIFGTSDTDHTETEAADVKFIIGLGNPGRDYAGTRHNIGFEVIDRLAGELRIDINRAKFRAHYGEGFLGTQKIVLVKPQTYMNLSGESVRDMLHFYKRTPADIMVVYDDCDLQLGQIRIRERGSAGTHNGMKSLIYQLDTDEFVRIRVGIGNKPARMELASFVLSKFTKQEQEEAAFSVIKAADAALAVLREGATSAMNKFNAVLLVLGVPAAKIFLEIGVAPVL